MERQIFILLTADCETAKCELTPYAVRMSGSGPDDYQESARSIQGYAAVARAHGYPLTLFVHPEVAAANRELLIDLQAEGACLGLHLHPYKFLGGTYRYDMGAYSPAEQREMLTRAVDAWEDALGSRPAYFRAGYFSANDSTFRVLHELGFRGGSLSNPGRILPQHHSVWAGAELYPHRAHLDFRQVVGESDFVEVPVAIDLQRPHECGHAGDKGYEWPYIPSAYAHDAVIRHIVARIRDDAPDPGVIVLDTHNDQDYTDPSHPARRNLELILRTAQEACAEMGLRLRRATVETIRDRVL